MRYWLTFTGKRLGALGIVETFRVEVEAESVEAARLKAYDTHEHITGGLTGVRVEEAQLYA